MSDLERQLAELGAALEGLARLLDAAVRDVQDAAAVMEAQLARIRAALP